METCEENGGKRREERRGEERRKMRGEMRECGATRKKKKGRKRYLSGGEPIVDLVLGGVWRKEEGGESE